jgi:hypothetical protein
MTVLVVPIRKRGLPTHTPLSLVSRTARAGATRDNSLAACAEAVR